MILKYDAKTRTTKNNDGVDIRVPGFGNTNTVEFLGDGKFAGEETVMYFHPIAEALVELGYVRGKNLLGAPYDFRKAASKSNISQFSAYFFRESNGQS